jgi:hypothetical protein
MLDVKKGSLPKLSDIGMPTRAYDAHPWDNYINHNAGPVLEWWWRPEVGRIANFILDWSVCSFSVLKVTASS